ncbi:glycosyltransferase 8 protein [Cymbomonas tetramitiformis]|uniref:Hexosyltransferase n=1 Tax=Cymbomonas tetramitiformis TaxID=36881 RepID=A0AAE0L607_9CHLO|nr:glycosyltransferase 8 protein [Cymbomonas tetramitiformis]
MRDVKPCWMRDLLRGAPSTIRALRWTVLALLFFSAHIVQVEGVIFGSNSGMTPVQGRTSKKATVKRVAARTTPSKPKTAPHVFDRELQVETNFSTSPPSQPLIDINQRVLAVDDICKRKRSTCTPGARGREGYVFFLSNSTNLAVPDGQRDSDDHLTYFDYLHAAVNRLQSLTNLTILILLSDDVPEQHRTALASLSPGQVEIRVITPAYKQIAQGLHTNRAYHLHSFGKLEVFNTEWTGDFVKLISLDPDTFVLKNVDEALCVPGGFAAVKRQDARGKVMDTGFNSGFFVLRPSKELYDALWKSVKSGASRHNQGKGNTNWFGEQPLLNAHFKNRMGCLSVNYNCLGFNLERDKGVKSQKCGIVATSNNDGEIWEKRKIVHAKLSTRKIFTIMPTVAAEWRKQLPPAVISREEARLPRVQNNTASEASFKERSEMHVEIA